MATLSQGAMRPNAWAVRTREVVYMAIGAALYGVLGWATAIARIPGPFNISARPAVVIPMFLARSSGHGLAFSQARLAMSLSTYSPAMGSRGTGALPMGCSA
jgi:hypothetical protein